MSYRKKRNSSKANLTFSIVFHALLLLGVAFFAAREGILGKQLKTLAVTMAPKEKKPEPPKPKPEEPKVQPPKQVEPPKMAAAPPPRVETAPPPTQAPVEAPPTVAAPAAMVLPSMDFNDGAKEVQSVSDPNVVYKGLVEHALRARWNRPEDVNDEQYVAEVELTVDTDGNITGSRWLKGSGDARWDASVKAALAATKVLSRPPPKGFPAQFVTRFDVESTRAENVVQVSSR